MGFFHHHHHNVEEVVIVQQPAFAPAPIYNAPPVMYAPPQPQFMMQPPAFAQQTIVYTPNFVNHHGKRAFQAHDGTFLTAEDGGLYNEPYLSHKAHIHLHHCHDDVYRLRTHHGKYLAIDFFGNLYTTYDELAETKFRVENINGRVAIKAHHGPYIGVRHGRVHVVPMLGEHELFNIMVV